MRMDFDSVLIRTWFIQHNAAFLKLPLTSDQYITRKNVSPSYTLRVSDGFVKMINISVCPKPSFEHSSTLFNCGKTVNGLAFSLILN